MRPRWQPNYVDVDEFSISLEGNFAREMAELNEERRELLDNQGENILDLYGRTCSQVYRYGEGLFVTSIHLEDSGARITTTSSLEEEYVVFDSYEVDTAEETVVIQDLFNEWIKTGEAILQEDY